MEETQQTGQTPPPIAGAPSAQQSPPAPEPVSPEKDVEENKDIAALSYVWILSVFVYFSKRHSPFVAFHAKQGMTLFVLSLVVWFVPYAGRFLELLVLGGAVLGFLAAAQGEWKELPLIGPLSRRDRDGVRKSWKGIVHSTAVAWDGFRKTMKREVAAQQDTPAASSPGPPPPAPVTPPPPAPAQPDGVPPTVPPPPPAV